MTIRGIGAVLIIASCGGFGYSMAAGIRQQEKLLHQLIQILQVMESELQYRLTSLPELCRTASGECVGPLCELFHTLAENLALQEHPDAAVCMDSALQCCENLPGRLKRHLRYLGKSLGRFDLNGQLEGLRRVRSGCESDLTVLAQNRDQRVRSYQTLSLCAGTALAILFV